jgi:hypothetical protein
MHDLDPPDPLLAGAVVRNFARFLDLAEIRLAARHCKHDCRKVIASLESMNSHVELAPGHHVQSEVLANAFRVRDKLRTGQPLTGTEIGTLFAWSRIFDSARSDQRYGGVEGVDSYDVHLALIASTSEPNAGFGSWRSLIDRIWRRAPHYPRVWGLLQYLLPHKARRDTFQPSYDELLADYYLTMRTYRSKPARGWLRFCFGFRTVLMLVECYRVLGLDRAARLLPNPLRRWWLS